MQRFCWRERSEKLNWRLLKDLDVNSVVQRGDPAVLEPYALHITFARLPITLKDSSIRDAWYLVRILQLAMEFLLFMRSRDGDVLESLNQESRLLEQERDELILSLQKWKARAQCADKQVKKLHQVLQNIAKLLQFHGASPSAVVTIQTLLTEIILEKQAKQRKRAVINEREENRDNISSVVQEARVCGYCGKLFSSTIYLEKHLVRRHKGESIKMEAPLTHAMKHDVTDETEKENKVEQSATEAAMQKMVQQIEKALYKHEEKIQSLAQDEEKKLAKILQRLQSNATVDEELKACQIKIDRLNEDSKRQLHEMCKQKQQYKDELGDLKQQIKDLTVKKKTMGVPNDVILPLVLSPKSDDALVATQTEVDNLRQTLKDVRAELISTQRELTKVQALHLLALKKKKVLSDKLALSCAIPTIARQGASSQTNHIRMTSKSVQTDAPHNHLSNEPSTVERQDTCTQSEEPSRVNEFVQTEHSTSTVLEKGSQLICKKVGTDPLILNDMGIQTHNFPDTQNDAEARFGIVNDSFLDDALTPVSASPNHGLLIVNSGEIAEKVDDLQQTSPIQAEFDVERTYIQQKAIQSLLDIASGRAQSAADKASSSKLPDSKSNSLSFRHNVLTANFTQHDNDLLKKQMACCLEQLELFCQRCGVPQNCTKLSEDHLQIARQALSRHLKVLPADVLSKMIICENTINAIIEKEWILTKTHAKMQDEDSGKI
ncbi:putative Zinc finger protein DZIP1 [Plasmopara halstedii]